MESIINLLYTYGPFIFLGLVFYFLLYRPQKKQQKARNQLIENLKVGHRVLSIGGIYGEIVYIDLKKSDMLTLRIAEKVDIKMTASSIVRNLTQEKIDANPANDK